MPGITEVPREKPLSSSAFGQEPASEDLFEAIRETLLAKLRAKA